MSAPAEVLTALSEIDHDLAGRQNDYESAVVALEDDDGAVFRQLDDRGKLLQPPAGNAATGHGLATHSDLVERRLDLMERQRARGR